MLVDELRSLTLEQAIKFWDVLEKKHDLEGIRWLCKNDRYYLLVRMLNRVDALHPWLYARCREVEANPDDYLDLWAREHYKAIDVNELVPTPTGFKPHGSLVVGDWVYGSDGSPVRVIARTPVFTDADCYRVNFDDDYSVVVSGNHLWTVEEKSRKRINGTNKRVCRESVTLSTKEVSERLHTPDNRLAIKVALPILNVEHLLPIKPYVLGAWLGDGTSANSAITCAYEDIEIIEHIKSFGCNVYERKSSNANSGLFVIDGGTKGKKNTGMTCILREINVQNNKHIPNEYLWANERQRRELLQGLMDTDGHCNTRGTATFVNINERLANDVFVLCASLGLKPRLNVFKNEFGNVYYVSFQSYKHDAPFRLSRKLARCKDGVRLGRRFIHAVEQVESIPVSCIQVDTRDGLYLIGKNMVTTHNSTIITFAGTIQEIINNPEITIGIFSHTQSTSFKFWNQIKLELETNTRLQKAFPDIFYTNPVKESSRWSEQKGLCVKRKNNPKEATLEFHGLVDGMPTGAHFKLRIYDDVVTDKSVTTPEQIMKTTMAWELSDNLGMSGGRKWHIGTRYHFGDTYGIILERGALKTRLYPATHDGTKEGNPVLLSHEEWEAKKLVQSDATLSCQMLQNPIAGQQAMFNVLDIQSYEIRPQTLNVYILVDPARSMKKGSANTAIAVLGTDTGRNKYLLDGMNHRMDLKARWEAVRDMRRKWINQNGVQHVYVGYESYGAQADLDYFREQMEVTNNSFIIEELQWPRDSEVSKDDRVQRLVPDLKSHKFYMPALIMSQGKLNWWAFDTEQQNKLVLTPHEGHSKAQKMVIDAGQPYRVCKPISRVDSENNLYDVSRHAMEQIMFYPFAPLKDLVDAISRIYDMEPKPPIIIDETELEPEVFND